MNDTDLIFIQQTVQKIKNHIPRNAKWEDLEFIEVLEKELGKILGDSCYHLIKGVNKQREQKKVTK